MSFRNLLTALVAVALTGCLMPVQTPTDGSPRLPDGGAVVDRSDGGNTDYTPVLTTVMPEISGTPIFIGNSVTLSASAFDQRGRAIGGVSFRWALSGTGTATLSSETGDSVTATGTGAGSVTAMVYATRGNESAQSSIEFVVAAPLTALRSIEVPTAPTTMNVGDVVTVPFVARDTNNEVVDQSTVEFVGFTFSSPNVLFLNRNLGSVTFTANIAGTVNWQISARRMGTEATVFATGTLVVKAPSTARIVSNVVTQPTSASNCLPLQFGAQPTTSGTFYAVSISGETCSPYDGELTWASTDTSVITVSGTGRSASWSAKSDGFATITAKSTSDNGATYSAELVVKVWYPVAILKDSTCTNTNTQLSLQVGEQVTLTLAKYKGVGSCDTSDNNVSWSNTNGSVVSLSSFSGKQITITANNAGSGSISGTNNTFGVGTNIEYTVANVPTPVFNPGSFTAQWVSGRRFSLSWPTATVSSGTVTYKLSGNSGTAGGKYAEEVVTGTSKTIDVDKTASDWVFTLKACNGSTNSCTSANVVTYEAAAPAPGYFTVLGSDRAYYRVALDGSGWGILGVAFQSPSAGLSTTPRPDGSGNLHGIAVNGLGRTVQVQKALNSTTSTFTDSQPDLGFSNASCPTEGLNLAAFPIGSSQLAFVSGASLLQCGRGQLVVATLGTSANQSLVASDVTAAAAAGADLGKLGYIYRTGLYVHDAATATTALPVLLSSTAAGQLLGTSNGFYALENNVLKQFSVTGGDQLGNDVTIPAAAVDGFTVADIDATRYAYGLPTGELVFMLKSNAGFGVATPTNATTFTGKKVAFPGITGVTFTLGTSRLQ